MEEKKYSCIAMMIGNNGFPYEETLIQSVSMLEANRVGLAFTNHCDAIYRICLGFYLRED